MLDGLIGKWKVIGCQLNGTWLPYSIFREFRYSFTADDRFNLAWAELSFPIYVGGFPKAKSGLVVLSLRLSLSVWIWFRMTAPSPAKL